MMDWDALLREEIARNPERFRTGPIYARKLDGSFVVTTKDAYAVPVMTSTDRKTRRALLIGVPVFFGSSILGGVCYLGYQALMWIGDHIGQILAGLTALAVLAVAIAVSNRGPKSGHGFHWTKCR